MAVGPLSVTSRNAGLEYLRFALSLCVLLFHYCYWGRASHRITDDFLEISSAYFLKFAVMAFFIVSGLVISLSAQGKTGAQFAASRVARLFPSLFVCTLLTTAIVLLLNWEGTDLTLIAVAKSMTFVPMLIGNPIAYADASYWSLTHELWFYLLVLVLISLALIDWLPEILFALCLAVAVVHSAGWLPDSFPYLLCPYGAFFALGVLLGRYGEGAARWRDLALFVGLLLIAGRGVYIGEIWRDIGVPLADLLSTIALIVGLCVGGVFLVMRFGGRLPFGPFAAAAGGISYPLYLLHQNAGFAVLNQIGDSIPPWFALTLTTGLMIFIAWCVWHLIEKFVGLGLRLWLQVQFERMPGAGKRLSSAGRLGLVGVVLAAILGFGWPGKAMATQKANQPVDLRGSANPQAATRALDMDDMKPGQGL